MSAGSSGSTSGGSGHELTLSRRIEAPPSRVWQVLTDLKHAPQVLSGVRSVELLTDGPYAVGTRWRETRTMMGRTVTEEMWVVDSDPHRRTEVAASSGGADYRTVFTLSPDGEGTSLTMHFSAHTPDPTGVQKVLWKAFGALGLRATRKAMETDLADIAAAAERSDGSPAGPSVR